jgi:hypothetical protein
MAHDVTLPMFAICKTKSPIGRNCGNVHNYKQKSEDVMLRSNPVSLRGNDTRTERLYEDLLPSPSLVVTWI